MATATTLTNARAYAFGERAEEEAAFRALIQTAEFKAYRVLSMEIAECLRDIEILDRNAFAMNYPRFDLLSRGVLAEKLDKHAELLERHAKGVLNMRETQEFKDWIAVAGKKTVE